MRIPLAILFGLGLTGPALAASLETVPVTEQSLPLTRILDGSVAAVRQSTVSAETAGRIADIRFDVGDTVPAGTVILRLVGIEQRAALNQAQAALAEAQANLDVQQREFQRVRELFERKLVSKSDVDRQTAAFNAAKARLASAEAGRKRAEEQASYTEVKAPYGGVVSARLVEPGEAVQPGTPLLTGFDPAAMRVQVDLPQTLVDAVRDLRQAQILLPDGQTLEPAKLILFPAADPATSTVKVRLDMPEDSPGLFPGQHLKVAFTVGETARRLIPLTAVVYRSEVTAVYVVKDGKPSLRQVRLGNRFGDAVEVLSGLSVGETLAADPIAAGIALHEVAVHGQ